MSKIIFTWDDNFQRHYNYIAPLFAKHKILCTFFVNPGWKSFEKKYLTGYKRIDRLGFEIGSHGFSHTHMTNLTADEFKWQLTTSKGLLEKWLEHPIYSFAFPHHDYNDNMLIIAKKYYYETRNTIPNSVRYSLKTNLNIDEIIITSKEIIESGKSLVFSGHSIALTKEELIIKPHSLGYEPILLSDLEKLLLALIDQYGVDSFTTVSNLLLKLK